LTQIFKPVRVVFITVIGAVGRQTASSHYYYQNNLKVSHRSSTVVLLQSLSSFSEKAN